MDTETAERLAETDRASSDNELTEQVNQVLKGSASKDKSSAEKEGLSTKEGDASHSSGTLSRQVSIPTGHDFSKIMGGASQKGTAANYLSNETSSSSCIEASDSADANKSKISAKLATSRSRGRLDSSNNHQKTGKKSSPRFACPTVTGRKNPRPSASKTSGKERTQLLLFRTSGASAPITNFEQQTNNGKNSSTTL